MTIFYQLNEKRPDDYFDRLLKKAILQAVQKRLDARRPSTGSGQALKSVMVSLSNRAAQHADAVPMKRLCRNALLCHFEWNEKSWVCCTNGLEVWSERNKPLHRSGSFPRPF